MFENDNLKWGANLLRAGSLCITTWFIFSNANLLFRFGGVLLSLGGILFLYDSTYSLRVKVIFYAQIALLFLTLMHSCSLFSVAIQSSPFWGHDIYVITTGFLLLSAILFSWMMKLIFSHLSIISITQIWKKTLRLTIIFYLLPSLYFIVLGLAKLFNIIEDFGLIYGLTKEANELDMLGHKLLPLLFFLPLGDLNYSLLLTEKRFALLGSDQTRVQNREPMEEE